MNSPCLISLALLRPWLIALMFAKVDFPRVSPQYSHASIVIRPSLLSLSSLFLSCGRALTRFCCVRSAGTIKGLCQLFFSPTRSPFLPPLLEPGAYNRLNDLVVDNIFPQHLYHGCLYLGLSRISRTFLSFCWPRRS